MKSNYRVVGIGGGVVGASVLYHLAKFGWDDVCLIERSVLTAGSSWHAAGGFHALNADPNIAALQAYTIDLLSEIEKESGQSVGMHMTGGMTLAGTPDRWEWLHFGCANGEHVPMTGEPVGLAFATLFVTFLIAQIQHLDFDPLWQSGTFQCSQGLRNGPQKDP